MQPGNGTETVKRKNSNKNGARRRETRTNHGVGFWFLFCRQKKTATKMAQEDEKHAERKVQEDRCAPLLLIPSANKSCMTASALSLHPQRLCSGSRKIRHSHRLPGSECQRWDCNIKLNCPDGNETFNHCGTLEGSLSAVAKPIFATTK